MNSSTMALYRDAVLETSKPFAGQQYRYSNDIGFSLGGCHDVTELRG